MKRRVFIDAQYGSLVQMEKHPDGIWRETQRQKMSDTLKAFLGEWSLERFLEECRDEMMGRIYDRSNRP